jgi:large conductance mechanosensitive channel
MLKTVRSFKDFVMRGNILDLAVAVIMGIAFGAVVTSLVKDLITPIIAAIVGKPDFSALSFTIHKSTFRYGDFINAALNFVLVAAAIYFFVILPITHLTELRERRRAAGEPDAADAARTDEAILLAEIRDLLKPPGDRQRQICAVARSDGEVIRGAAAVRAGTTHHHAVTHEDRRPTPRPARRG